MFKNGQIVSIINNSEIENNTTLMNLQDEELILRINNDNFLLEHLNGQLVKDEYGKEVIVSPQLLKKVENPKVKELKVGDKVTFLDVLSPFKRYGETIASTYMASFKGKQCTVSYINEDNTFKIEEDNKGYLFSRGMTKDYTMIDEKLHFDLDYFKEQDVDIRIISLLIPKSELSSSYSSSPINSTNNSNLVPSIWSFIGNMNCPS